jgi:hypothetical protein
MSHKGSRGAGLVLGKRYRISANLRARPAKFAEDVCFFGRYWG